MHEHALGTSLNLAEALRWYRMAADRGDGPAQLAADALCARAAVQGCKGGEVIVLLAEEDGKIGKVLVQGLGGGEVLLDDAMDASRVSSGSAVALAISEEDLQEIFADVPAAEPREPSKFVLYFRLGTTELVTKSHAELPKILSEVEDRAIAEVVVVGHTDRLGEEWDNDALSLARAESVRDQLVAQGLDDALVETQGLGERVPKVKTGDGVRQAKNRRVEVTVR